MNASLDWMEVFAPPRELVLYDYQLEAVEKLRENIRAGVANQVLSSATGSGKTVIAMHLLRECYEKGKRGVLIVDRLSLLGQSSDQLDKYGIPHGVIQSKHWRHAPHQPIQVASAQTLARRQWPEADLICVDECHGYQRIVLDRIAKRDCVVVGLTATPFTKGMAKHYDAVVSVTTTNKLIEQKFLAPYKIWAPAEPDMTGAKVVAGEWTDEVAAERAMPIVGDVVAEYLKHGENAKAICFGATIKHCEEMQRQFMAAGVQAALYTNDTGDDERTVLLQEFKKPDSYIRVLLSVAALARGFDSEDLGVVILARPLRSSLAEHVQQIGRGLRRDPNNPEKLCKIFDMAGNYKRFHSRMMDFFAHGAQTLDDGSKKKEQEKAAPKAPKPVKCPECSLIHNPRPTCPGCGHEYKRSSGIIHRAGELVELNGSFSPGNNDTATSFYAQLVYIGIERGYKSGWAWNQFREKYGVQPPRITPAPEVPTYGVLQWVKSRMIRYAKGKQKANR